jgi:hypothetical protein
MEPKKFFVRRETEKILRTLSQEFHKNYEKEKDSTMVLRGNEKSYDVGFTKDFRECLDGFCQNMFENFLKTSKQCIITKNQEFTDIITYILGNSTKKYKTEDSTNLNGIMSHLSLFWTNSETKELKSVRNFFLKLQVTFS